jgi:rhodanese-related sulfurtransferase
MMMRDILAAVSIVVAAGVSEAGEPMTPEAVTAAARTGITFVDNDHITARQAANPDLLLLDVRSEAEFTMGHIPGAKSIARGVIEFRLAETVRDADTEIVVYCATGSRAALVTKALMAQGYRNVSAHEGFDTWAGASLPVENAYGRFELIEREKSD